MGNLIALKVLGLGKNKLSGPIPSSVGTLKALTELYLWDNELTGSIPPTLGGLSRLLKLDLSRNKLSGSIPPEIGSLSQLTLLQLFDNELTGDLPSSFLNLTLLEKLNCQQRDGFIVSGGPNPGESMDTWRLRRKALDQTEDSLPSELLRLTRENRVMSDEVRELTAGTSASFDAMPQAESLPELDRLVGMARHLEEIAASKIKDDQIQQKEHSLVQGSMEEAHYTTLRDGLYKAYLASCVIGSKLVSTSQTGTMGKAGKVLTFIARVTPMLGGLASVAAATLKSGDHFIQTQRVVKIAEMGSDVMECSKVAKRVAMKITEGLRDLRIDTSTQRVDRTPFVAVAGLAGTLGGLKDSVDAETVLDWFAEEVASDAADSIAAATDRSIAAKDGGKYGAKHLCMILKAIGRDCLKNVTDTNAKVDTLAAVVLGRAALLGGRSEEPVKHIDVDASVAARFPVVPPSDQLEAVTQGNVDSLRTTIAETKSEVETLKRQNSELQKKMVKLEEDAKYQEVSGVVDAGGGQLYANKQVRQRETAEDFWRRAEGKGSSEDRESVGQEELLRLQAEHIAILKENQALMEKQMARLEAEVAKKKDRNEKCCVF